MKNLLRNYLPSVSSPMEDARLLQVCSGDCTLPRPGCVELEVSVAALENTAVSENMLADTKFSYTVWSVVFWANLRKRTADLLVGLNHQCFLVSNLFSKKSEIFRKTLRKPGKKWLTEELESLPLSFVWKGAHLSVSDERKLVENFCHLVRTKLDKVWGAGFSLLSLLRTATERVIRCFQWFITHWHPQIS